MDIYLYKDKHQVGPLDESQVRAGIEAGTYSLDTLSWKEGLPSWIPLSQLLDASRPVTPPPLPVTADQTPNTPVQPLPPMWGTAVTSGMTDDGQRIYYRNTYNRQEVLITDSQLRFPWKDPIYVRHVTGCSIKMSKRYPSAYRMANMCHLACVVVVALIVLSAMWSFLRSLDAGLLILLAMASVGYFLNRKAGSQVMGELLVATGGTSIPLLWYALDDHEIAKLPYKGLDGGSTVQGQYSEIRERLTPIEKEVNEAVADYGKTPASAPIN